MVPSSVTVATLGVKLVHFSVWLSASVGRTFASNFVGMVFVTPVVLRLMSDTFNGATVTLQEADTPEQPAAVAVTVAVPTFTALTTPLEVTVATDSSELVHVTLLSSASLGNADAVSVADFVLTILNSFCMSMESTSRGVTVTVVVPATFDPSLDVALIVAVPVRTPVISPVSASTFTISGLLLLHVRF